MSDWIGNKKAAQAQALQLQSFWKDRGICVKTQTFNAGTPTKPIWCVRSDIGKFLVSPRFPKSLPAGGLRNGQA